MFTGIVECTGRVTSLGQMGAGWRLRVDAGGLNLDGAIAGESIAVNGACLTLVSCQARELAFDLSSETMKCTALGSLEGGDFVNLERALRVGDRLGGHFVSGHVDGIGQVVALEDRGRSLNEEPDEGDRSERDRSERDRSERGQAKRDRAKRDRAKRDRAKRDRGSEVRYRHLRIAAPEAIRRYLAVKGSVTVDGVSLTINALDGAEFELMLVPHTLERTTLGNRTRGDTVNLEVDLLARYLERLQMEAGASTPGSGD